MIQIFPANKLISSILGKQTFTRDDSYRLSFFCLCKTVDKGTLIFNNLTKELVIIESPLSALNDEEQHELVNRWFFVEENADEQKTANELMAILRLSHSKIQNKSFTILPTTGCNARCFYCFEKGVLPQSMSEATALQVGKFIIMNSQNANHISLNWFGGEPLLNTGAINIICDYLKNNCSTEYSSSIVTNGYLLNNELIDHAMQLWKLKKVQITLDGTESIYNKAKSYIYSNCNAYRTVLNNIVDLSQYDISIDIRLNIAEYNITDMHNLITELAELLTSKEHFRIHLVPLFEHAGATEIVRSEEQRSLLYKKIAELNQLLLSSGFYQQQTLDRTLHVNSCGADNKNSVVIMPNGDLIRCEHIVETTPHGNVYSDSSMSDGLWTQYYSPLAICTNCPMYPTCHRLVGCKEAEDCSASIQNKYISATKECMVAEYERFIAKSKQ